MNFRSKIALGLLLSAITGTGIHLAITKLSTKREVETPLGLSDEDMRRIARLGDGFLVWERYKSGAWQIWTKKLDGGEEERLVPLEKGRDHFCPKISPDGRQLAFMSYERGENAYPAHAGATGALCLMDLINGTQRVIEPEARSYAEDHAVVWRDERTLFYINKNGETMQLSLKTDERRKVLDYKAESFGYLPSPDLRHATTGTPEFADVDPDGRIHHRKLMDGCQPYFTANNAWGYWMGGAGGPVKAISLDTRQIKNMLERNDPRLNTRRNYVYFPMMSACMRLLAFAASPDRHDHFNADYDLYVAMVNPQTMDLIGRPVRYTKFDGCDRYPDVFRRELALGTHFVEAGATLKLNAPKRKGLHDFNFGDGTQGAGRTVQHIFRKPGDYWITAVSRNHPEVKRMGFVHVDPASPPSVVDLRRSDSQHVLVQFNEDVDISQAVSRLSDGRDLTIKLLEGDRGMSVELPENIALNASISIEGVSDRSRRPNKMQRQVYQVPDLDWPPAGDGLVFAWQNVRSGNALPDGDECRVTPQGLAFWDADGAMKLRGGAFISVESGRHITEACGKTGAFSIEAIITSECHAKSDDAILPVITLGDRDTDASFMIGQQGKSLCMTSAGRSQLQRLATVEVGKPMHVLLTREPSGKTTVYINRKSAGVFTSGDSINDWKPGMLRFGSVGESTHRWRGQIERVAVYSRVLKPAEAESHARVAYRSIHERTVHRRWNVECRLVETSDLPGLQEIQPYKEGLIRRLFEVKRNLSGDGLLPPRIVVTQWVWLGGRPMPAQDLKVGDTVNLTLEEPQAHPELHSLYVKDQLTEDFDALQLIDVSELDEPVMRISPDSPTI